MSIPFRLLDADVLIDWLGEVEDPAFERASQGAFVLIPFVAVIEMERRLRELLASRQLHPFEEDELRARLDDQEAEILYPDRDTARDLIERMKASYRAQSEANTYCEWLRVLAVAVRRTGADDVRVLTRSPFVAELLGEDAILLVQTS
ncbi:hypothetical protein EON79_00980 [bacterium]|nr:MAG: hypothetical protein EON79_00980 [bacterium]